MKYAQVDITCGAQNNKLQIGSGGYDLQGPEEIMSYATELLAQKKNNLLMR